MSTGRNVLEIRMQSYWIDCSECGRRVHDREEMTGERDVGESGIAGWRPLCKPCARRLGDGKIDTTGTTGPVTSG